MREDSGWNTAEPKPTVEFAEVPDIPMRQYAKLARTHGVVLAPGSIALYDNTHFFLNGEAYEPEPELAQWLRRLADYRQLSAKEMEACAGLPDLLDTFHHWSLEGWLQLSPPAL